MFTLLPALEHDTVVIMAELRKGHLTVSRLHALCWQAASMMPPVAPAPCYSCSLVVPSHTDSGLVCVSSRIPPC